MGSALRSLRGGGAKIQIIKAKNFARCAQLRFSIIVNRFQRLCLS